MLELLDDCRHEARNQDNAHDTTETNWHWWWWQTKRARIGVESQCVFRLVCLPTCLDHDRKLHFYCSVSAFISLRFHGVTILSQGSMYCSLLVYRWVCRDRMPIVLTFGGTLHIGRIDCIVFSTNPPNYLPNSKCTDHIHSLMKIGLRLSIYLIAKTRTTLVHS